VLNDVYGVITFGEYTKKGDEIANCLYFRSYF
jgi:hypothetical protein